MLGAACSPCCDTSCACPSWCSYKMILSSPKTCPGYYPSTGDFTCPGDAAVSVESPYTCGTTPQVSVATAKGILSYRDASSNWLWLGFNPTLEGGPQTPDDVWKVLYPSLAGNFSGQFFYYQNSAFGTFSRDLHSTAYEASINPFCTITLGQPSIGIELVYETRWSISGCNRQTTAPFALVCSTVRTSFRRTKRKTVFFNVDCISDASKWCPGVSGGQFKPFPNPFSGWMSDSSTSYGNYDSEVVTSFGNSAIGSPALPFGRVLPTVYFDIVQRESCADGNPLP